MELFSDFFVRETVTKRYYEQILRLFNKCKCCYKVRNDI